MIPAPETARPIKLVIDETIGCKEGNERKVMAFYNCRHGLPDLGVRRLSSRKALDYEPAPIQVQTYVN